MTTSLPNPEDLVSFGHAAAGHAGTMSDEDGKLFIKPCVQAEIDFYTQVREKNRKLMKLIPKHMGDLSLMSPEDESIKDAIAGLVSEAGAVGDREQLANAISEQISNVTAGPSDERKQDEWVPTKGGKIKTNKAVVLQNNTYGYVQPNILDLKLGVRLWADDAPQKKKDKFDKISEETTHKNFGFRVAGMRAYKGSEDPAELDEDGYKVHDKDYGRLNVNDDNLVSEIGQFVFNKAAGIDEEMGKRMCKEFTDAVAKVVEVLEDKPVEGSTQPGSEYTRMYSASLLFVFEGDGKALRKAIDHADHKDAPRMDMEQVRRNIRTDSGIGLEERDDDDSSLEDDDDDEDFSDDENAPPPLFSVKLIDFAHATFVDREQGPDENMLKGVRSIKNIFQELSAVNSTKRKRPVDETQGPVQA